MDTVGEEGTPNRILKHAESVLKEYWLQELATSRWHFDGDAFRPKSLAIIIRKVLAKNAGELVFYWRCSRRFSLSRNHPEPRLGPHLSAGRGLFGSADAVSRTRCT